jgi:two-component system nitrate/nitrite response regulator NarL
MTDPIRVVVADDHPLFLDGVVAALGSAGDIEVVGSTSDGSGALRLTRELHPDLVLLDVTMPGGGLQTARQISAAFPETKIVMLTVSEDEDDIMAAMKAGASGYALKGIPARELARIVRSIAGGERYIAPSLAFGMLQQMMKPPSTSPLDALSSREREVLELVAVGLSNSEIGVRLNLAEKTIKHYMTNVLSKLGVSTRVEAALLAHKMGLLDGGSQR